MPARTGKTAKTSVDTAELDASFRHAAGCDDQPDDWTPVGGWVRVSTGGQDEASQVPDIIRYCVERKYWLAKWFVVHGKSAFKAAQDPDWQKVVTSAGYHEIQAAVLWKVDRLDRGNILHAIPMANALLTTGAKLEFATQPYITLDTMPGRMAFANMCEMAHEESKTKSDRVKAKIVRIEANNGLTGKPPFGYRSEPRGDGYKNLVPTEDGRKYVPLIFEMVADGWSALAVAEWLDTEHVKPTQGTSSNWSPKSVLNIIRNQTYIGERQARKDGRVVLNGITKLVDEKLWLAANKRVDSAPRGRRGPRDGNPALLTGSLLCFACGAPMYRLIVNAKNGKRYDYYRCNGHLPNPKGCGVMVKCEELEAIVDKSMLADHQFVYERTFIAGDEPEIKLEIDRINVKLRKLPTMDLPEDEEDAERQKLRAAKHELEDKLKDAKTDRWDWVEVMKDDGTPLTESERWDAADFDGKRRILLNHRVRFGWDVIDGKRYPNVVMGPLWAEPEKAAERG